MRRGQFILVIALALGVCMFFCSHYWLREQPVSNAMPQERESLLPELEWLRQRLRLDEAQFEKVKALHLAYRPKCQELCMRAQEAEAALRAVMRDPQKDPSAALKTRAELQVECQQAMLAHVRQTAACMTPEQAKHYLDTLLPHVLGLRLPRDSESSRSR
ncbi:periplasmic heavy metal sensor [Prosthecobacter sp.]|uniref:periplasmic heavy metal sensor n=1 Tax=Prosthecobacter sp. TaxID=1965333 RepID=UPI002ABC3BE0|nr:periplasmic heavy metal sensor [Prosthecobacter sp.]MDZ4405549.1 periplasmic heavy metal sensor [Prosthecobacter sp.]